MSAKQRSRFSGLRITRGALIVAGLELGLSLVWLLSDLATRAPYDAVSNRMNRIMDEIEAIQARR